MQELSRRVLLIINPISGRPRTGRLLRQLRATLAQRGFELIEHQTSGPDEATIVAAAAPADTRAVLVYGGDGTVREVAAGLLHRPIPIYHLPVGNENLFAKHFGMSFHASWVADALEARRTRTIDLVEVNKKVAAACLGIGFDAEVVRKVAGARTGHVSNLDYVGPIARTLFHYDWPSIEVHAEGRLIFSGRGMAFAGNLSRYAVGIPLFKRAVDDDGLLDVVVFPCQRRFTFVGHLLRTLAQRHYEHKRAIFLWTAELRIDGEPGVATQVDGDVGPALPIEAVVRPASLNVLLSSGV